MLSRPQINLAIIGTTALIVAVVSCAPRPSTPPPPPEIFSQDDDVPPIDRKTVDPSPQYSDPVKQMSWIRVSKDAVRASLKDPESATFRNTEFYSGGGIPVTCGEVNAKNSFGGYTGFEPFIAAGDQMVVLASQMESPAEFNKLAKKFCVKG